MDLKKKVGNGVSIPLSFYFDLSGSMDKHIAILSLMALRMLKRDVKIIIGFNQNAYVQINKINPNCSNEQFKFIMSNLRLLVYAGNFLTENKSVNAEEFRIFNGKKFVNVKEFIIFNKQLKDSIENKLAQIKGLELESLNGIEIDEYLIEKKAEKVVVFSDFDPKIEIENLSQKCEVYWFCFIEECLKGQLDRFKGKFFKTLSKKDIMLHLQNINSKMYEIMQRTSSYFKSYQYKDYYEHSNMKDTSNYNLGEYDEEYELLQ